MAVRNETVRLTLDDDFTSKMAKVAATTALASKALKDLDGQNTKSSSSTKAVGDGVEELGKSSKSAATDVDRLTSKLGAQERQLNDSKALLRGLRAEFSDASGDTSHLTDAISKQETTIVRQTKAVNETRSALHGYQLQLAGVGDDLGKVGSESEKAAQEVEKSNNAFTKGQASIDKYSGRLSLLAQAAVVIGPALIPLTAGAIPAVAGLTAGLGAAAGAFGVTLLAIHGLGDGLKALNNYQIEPTASNLAKMQDEMKQLGPAGAEFVRYLGSLEPQLAAVQQIARAGLFPGVEAGIESLMQRLPQVKSIIGNIGATMGDLAAELGKNLASPKFDSFFNYLQTSAGPILHTFAAAAGNVGEALANLLVAFDPLSKSFSGGLLRMSQAFAEWSRHLDTNDGFQKFLSYVQENGPKTLAFMESLVHALASIVQAAAPVGAVVLPALTDLLRVLSSIASSDFGAPIVAAAAAMSVLSRSVATYSAVSKAALATNPWIAGAAITVGAVVSVQHSLDDLKSATDNAQAALNSGDTSRMRAQLKLLDDQIAQSQTDNKVKNPLDFLNHPQDLIGGLGEFKAIGTQVLDWFDGTTDKAKKTRDAIAGALNLRQYESNIRGMGPAINNFLVGPLGLSADAFENAARGADDFTKSLTRVNDLLDKRSAYRTYQAAIDDATAAIKANGKTLDANTEKGRANGQALDTIAQSALTFAQHLKGADRVDFLEHARAAFVDAATKMGKGNDAAQKWADNLHLLSTIDVKPKVGMDSGDFDKKSGVVQREIAKIGKNGANPFVGLFTAHFDAGAKRTTNTLHGLDKGSANPFVSLNTGKYDQGARHVDSDLGRLGRAHATPTVALNTNLFSSAVAQVRATLAQLDGAHATTYVTTVRHMGTSSAQGDIFKYANGDVRNGHQPEVAGPGPTRMWREPETQGESYIPLANDGRRPRAKSILEETASIFGGSVQWFANGDVTKNTHATRHFSGAALSVDAWGIVEETMNAWDMARDVMTDFSFHTKKAGQAIEKELKAREKLLANAVKWDQRAADRDKKEADAEKQRLDNLKQERQQLIDSVAGRVAPSLGNTPTPDSLLPTINVQTAPTAGAVSETMERSDIMARLRARGVPVRLLIALAGASIEELRVLDKYGDTQLAAYEQKYANNVTAASPLGSGLSQLANAQQFEAVIKELMGEGLTGAALADAATTGTLAQLQQLALGGAGVVGQYTQAFNATQAVAQQAGVLVGNDNYGKAIAEQTAVFQNALAEFKASKLELREANKALRAMQKSESEVARDISHIKVHQAKDTGTAVASALNKTGATIARRNNG